MTQKFPLQVVVSGQDAGATALLRRVGRTARQQMRDIRASSTSASDAVRGLGSGMASLARTGVTALAAGTALVGGAALATAKSFVEAGSELDDFAKKTGLGVEQIQAWRYAMEQSGVSTETFNGGLLTFSKGLGLARSGTGKLAAGLKKMSPELLNQLKKTNDLDEALRVYLAAMEQVPDESRRIALGSAAFGGAAADIAMAAGEGSEALQRLRREKMRDGVMSAEAAAKAADLGDKMDRLKSRYEQVKNTIGQVTAEALEPHLSALADWAAENEDLIAQNVAGAVDALASAFSSIDWQAIGSGISDVMDVLRGMKEVALDVAEAIRLIPREVNEVPWADSVADVIFDQDNQPRAGATWTEQLIRNMAQTGQLSASEAQSAARGWWGFGLANLVAPGASPDFVRAARRAGAWAPSGGPGGLMGESAVKERAIGAAPLPARIAAAATPPPGGTITVKLEAAPGTTATVVKSETTAPVKVETGRRTVGTRPAR